MIKDIEMSIKINHANRKKYELKFNETFKNGQTIKIKQTQILETTRTEVKCICDYCNKDCYKKRVDIKLDSKTFCNKDCKNNFLKNLYLSDKNPNPKKDKIKVNCEVCNKEFLIFESKFKNQKNFVCSRDCYKKHRSNNYNGSNIYNYQDSYVPCEMCKKNVKTSKWYMENKKHIFCSQDCYWEHRSIYYKEFYYDSSLNDSRKETKPEKLVREWLEDNKIYFIQEAGFIRKYFADFYIPKTKTIIEVYGDYWHVNPNVYDINNDDNYKKKLHKNQIDFLGSNYDEIRKKELESLGYNVCILWEKDIMNDLENNIKKIVNVNDK